MRRINLKIAAVVTLATLATAAPVLASSSSTMPPCTSPTLCMSTAGDNDVKRGVDPDGREGTGSSDPGRTTTSSGNLDAPIDTLAGGDTPSGTFSSDDDATTEHFQLAASDADATNEQGIPLAASDDAGPEKYMPAGATTANGTASITFAAEDDAGDAGLTKFNDLTI